VKRDLERIEIPGEHDARERTWTVVSAAFSERQPLERTRRMLRPTIAIAFAIAALAAVLSPSGRAVLDEIREVVGVERAQPALFSLPAPGRLLVSSDAGVWVVEQNGSKRLLGEYREASWSPFGRFVVAARENELAALEPDGDVRWTLARRNVTSPRWAGTETDTRIAYLSGRQPRSVAGDGTGDRRACLSSVHARRNAPEWQPGSSFALGLVGPTRAVHVLDLGDCSRLWSSSPIRGPRRIEWSSDGKRLLVITHEGVVILRPRSGTREQLVRVRDAAYRPGSRELATLRTRNGAGEVTVGGRVVFRGNGTLRGVTWSPDGRWLLVGWPSADQWVFVRADGKRIRAVSNVSEQFRSRSFPMIDGWCCAS
jgi:hypothetical protein